MAFHIYLGQYSCSVVSDSFPPRELQHARPPCPSPTPGVQRLTSIESVMPSIHLILYRPLLLPPSIFPSIRVFSNKSILRIRWPKYWSFSVSISPSGLISFRMDYQFSSIVSNSLRPHESQHARPPCTSPTPGVHSYSRPSTQ